MYAVPILNDWVYDPTLIQPTCACCASWAPESSSATMRTTTNV